VASRKMGWLSRVSVIFSTTMLYCRLSRAALIREAILTLQPRPRSSRLVMRLSADDFTWSRR
jgi:hypothetical protein